LHFHSLSGRDEATRVAANQNAEPAHLYEENQFMATSYDVHYPNDMMEASQGQLTNWAESTIHSVVDSLEDYARAKPLSFALWAFGVGFALGWKLKPW
jgi:hypothetical protein